MNSCLPDTFNGKEFKKPVSSFTALEYGQHKKAVKT
jgi:hypothetical protein